MKQYVRVIAIRPFHTPAALGAARLLTRPPHIAAGDQHLRRRDHLVALIVLGPRASEARGTRVALRVSSRVGDGSADADALGGEARAELDSRGPLLALLEGIELGDCAGGGAFAIEAGRCVTPVCPPHLGLDHVGIRLFFVARQCL